MSDVIAVYEVPGPLEAATAAARAIAFEETVEVPFDFPLNEKIRNGIVGRPGEPTALPNGRFRVAIAFPEALCAGGFSSLLNLTFGNVSIWSGIRLLDIQFPDSFLARLKGPNFGVKGLRDILGVRDRPLLATALKPMGSTPTELAKTAAEFAAGGGDIVKDDQNIVDRDLAAFKERVERIAAAVEHENARAGRLCVYFPHLSGPHEELEERLSFALEQGSRGVLICPAIVGLDQTRQLSQNYSAIFMAHPAFSGAFYADRAHGIETSFYLGTLMRAVGADITVFPNAGGRFAFTREECRQIAARSRAPLGALANAWPAPGGGMRLDNTRDMSADFGTDAIWLVGGSLLMHPGGVKAGAEAFREAISKTAETT